MVNIQVQKRMGFLIWVYSLEFRTTFDILHDSQNPAEFGQLWPEIVWTRTLTFWQFLIVKISSIQCPSEVNKFWEKPAGQREK